MGLSENILNNMKSEKLTDGEIIVNLMQEEMDAVDSYESKMAMTDNEQLKKLLSHIRDEEKEHIRELNNAKYGKIEVHESDGEFKRYRVSFYVDTDTMNNMDIEEAVDNLLKGSGLASADESIDVELVN